MSESKARVTEAATSTLPQHAPVWVPLPVAAIIRAVTQSHQGTAPPTPLVVVRLGSVGLPVLSLPILWTKNCLRPQSQHCGGRSVPSSSHCVTHPGCHWQCPWVPVALRIRTLPNGVPPLLGVSPLRQAPAILPVAPALVSKSASRGLHQLSLRLGARPRQVQVVIVKMALATGSVPASRHRQTRGAPACHP